jgi:hypothetical protein
MTEVKLFIYGNSIMKPTKTVKKQGKCNTDSVNLIKVLYECMEIKQ